MPNDEGIGYVDYVLWGNDGLPLASWRQKGQLEVLKKENNRLNYMQIV